MKNIYILPTDKPSRLHLAYDKDYYLSVEPFIQLDTKNYKSFNIYITSDEETKERVWCYAILSKQVFRNVNPNLKSEDKKKIILTTDQDLIADGVQAIDDEFLEWLVKNQSCEWVEVKSWAIDKEWDETYKQFNPIYPQKTKYKIIIPKEEPKQETLEEAAEKLYLSHENNELLYGHSEDLQLAYKAGILDGAKWQAERMYSEADKIMKFLDTEVELKLSDKKTIERIKWYFETYFEQFKKK